MCKAKPKKSHRWARLPPSDRQDFFAKSRHHNKKREFLAKPNG
jgi:hypothetical protein